MFSPMGKKKILLEQRYTSTKGRDSSPTSELGNTGEFAASAVSSKSRKNRSSKDQNFGDSIASTSNLEKALADMGTLGVVMRKIMESTVRYRPEKDAVILKAFQSKHIEYDKFRAYLYSAFWLGFEDNEFESFLAYFDPQKDGILNGYDFMIAFTRLNAMRKARESLAVREKQELFLLQQKEEEERKQLEKEKKMELAADFSFSDEVRARAISKLKAAAFKFDPKHPASGSTEAFNVNMLQPAVFKEMLKLTFNLKVDRSELGAILKEFDPNMESTQIPASEFLRYFLRLGIDARDKARMDQRQRQLEMSALAESVSTKRLTEAEAKMNLEVDYNFSESAEESAKDKLRIASTKYDRYATGAVALDGFECESLDPGAFKDLLRRVFNITLNSGELGYVIKRYDMKNTGKVLCKPFLTDFLRMGQEMRYKEHVEQLERQRTMIEMAHENHQKKIAAVQNSESVRISSNFGDRHLKSALAKLTEAATRYDKVRGVSLTSFEPSNLSPLEFQKALKRTFNIKLTPQEMGATVDYFDKDGSKTVHCQTFLSTFTILGANKKAEVRSQQLKQQRDDWVKQGVEAEKKNITLSSKILYNVDFDFTEVDKETAVEKMTAAAVKYDASHPAALGLEGFERKSMAAAEFKELVRRTFHLKLSATEVGALFEFFNAADNEIDCKEFVRHFLHLGIAERNKVKKEQLERQRKEDREREEEHERKLFEAANRQTFTPDAAYTDVDKQSILEKINAASEGFDKSHPAAPSLEAFEVAYLSPGLFRENLKRVFNILATPKEIGYLMDEYDKAKNGKIDSKEFMIKFLASGKRIRDEKRRQFLEETRLAQKQAVEEEERKVSALWDKAELQVDYETTGADLKSAIEKMAEASFKYDKTHPSAPSLDGFSGGPIKPGVFRELVRRAFNIWFEPKELGAVVKRYQHEKLRNMVDGKVFLIAFMKLGFDGRARNKAHTLQKQRQDELTRKHEAEMKLHMSAQRVALDLETDFADADYKSAMKKLTAASALYDKNAPGCVALDAFDAAFLTPGMFREVAKRTFNLVFEPKELAAMINQFENGKGNLDCQKFLVHFIRVGAEEREKAKVIQLEKQRRDDSLRKSDHDRKLKALESKLVIDVSYEYTDAERDSAFKKLTVAAKKYDKNHPGAMSLEGFEEKTLKPHVFREMIKRTFGVVLTPPELGACMHFFDPKKTLLISSRKFLIYFLKLGIAEREADMRSSLSKLRADEALRIREHEEKLAAQWAKMELNLTFEFTEADTVSALEKLAEAAFKFDPASPGPMGLTAFNGKKMTPAVFKEMLRRTFNMKITAPELAALISEFDKDGSKQIDCAEFMVKFTTLGFDRRAALRTSQLNRQRKMDEVALSESIAKQKAADAKMEANLAMDFDSEDFNAALEKIRVIASNYDRSHPSAPSLKGFTGTNMKPNEFKDMLMRTFKVPLTDKQLGAMVSIFGVEKDEEVSIRDKNKEDGVRIDNAEFLKYFNKIQRDEQSKRHRERIAKERELVESEKEYQQQLEYKKKHDELKRLIYADEDEVTVLDKIRHAAQEYAVDSALYMDGMQGFKGPALPADKFRELFAKIFNVKFTFPEVGVILSILDLGGIGTIDGTRFLNWFYKICRHEERFMLGETTEPVTFLTLKAASTITVAGPPRAASRNGTATSRAIATASRDGGSTSIARSWANSSTDYLLSDGSVDSSQVSSRNKGMSNNGIASKKPGSSYAPLHINSKYSLSLDDGDFSAQQTQSNNAQSFTESTINKNWILPSITNVASTPKSTAGFGSMMSLSEEEVWEAAEDARKHLSDVFNFQEADLHRNDRRNTFTSSAFLDDLDQAVNDDSSIYAFDGNLIPGTGPHRTAAASRDGSRASGHKGKSMTKHSSMGAMSMNSLTTAGSVTSDDRTAETRAHLRTAPAKQRPPRRVSAEATEPLAAVPAPSQQLLVPFDVSVNVPSRDNTANPTKGSRNRIRDEMNASDTSIAKSPTNKVALKPLPSTAEHTERKCVEDDKFMKAIFASEDQSPYAQMLKIPERYPMSTTNKQKDPLLRLKMANHHFHDSPIAHMKKKRPDIFNAEPSLYSSVPSQAAYIPTALPVGAPRSHLPSQQRASSPKSKSKPALSTSKSHDSALTSKGKEEPDKGTFFFPSLLYAGPGAITAAPEQADLTAPESPSGKATVEQSKKQVGVAGRLRIANVPDIDVVGSGNQQTELDDFSFLKSILL